jgi:hypothetical protein
MKIPNILYSLFLFFVLVYGCKKSDPFFDSLPKKFIFESIEIESPIRLFTNQKEVFDDAIINGFIENRNSPEYLSAPFLTNKFKGDVYNFVNSSVIKYTGIFNSNYDTLFYNKTGNSILIKTEKVYSMGNAFNCNSPLCHIESWKKDSITYYDNIYLKYSVQVYHKEYKVSGNVLYIPIVCYCYAFNALEVSGFLNNVFNEKVVSELTTDTLAIISYNLKFVEQ